MEIVRPNQETKQTPVQPPKKGMNGCLKVFLIFMGISVVLTFINSLFSDKKEIKTNEQTTKAKKVDTLQEVNNLITLINENKGKSYSQNPKLVGEHIALFRLVSDKYHDYKPTKNAEIIKKLEELKKITIKMQSEKFPQMRKNAVKTLKNSLWEHNVDVIDRGTTIELVGGYLASNSNKQATYDQLVETLKPMRFKKIVMKWYEYDDGVYYTIDSPKDSELIK